MIRKVIMITFLGPPLAPAEFGAEDLVVGVVWGLDEVEGGGGEGDLEGEVGGGGYGGAVQ